MNLDRGLAGEGGADFLAEMLEMRAVVERGVDELAQESVDVFLHELRGDGSDGEDIAGKALHLETDRAQLLDVRIEHCTFGSAALVKNRRQKLLAHGRVCGGAVEVAVVQNALVGDMLIDETQTGRRVVDDVAPPGLPH